MYLAHWDTELLLWRMFRLCSYIKSIALRSRAYGCNESLVQVQVNVHAWHIEKYPISTFSTETSTCPRHHQVTNLRYLRIMHGNDSIYRLYLHANNFLTTYPKPVILIESAHLAYLTINFWVLHGIEGDFTKTVEIFHSDYGDT
jgi:hypothetical protein